MENTRVIVTGGTRGIGAAITEAFLKKGAFVTATFNGNFEAAEKFSAKMSDYSTRLELRKFDVSDPSQVEEFFKSYEERHPSLEILINNSGIRKDNLVPLMSDDDFKSVMDVNLFGTFLMCKHAVKLFLKKRYGRIVNISSIGGNIGLPGQANYAASKAGQIALSKSLSKEVGKRNITVNCVLPGFIETELINDLPAEQIEEYKKTIPMKRFGKSEEVAAAVLFLASKEASYITGTTLEVSGGI